MFHQANKLAIIGLLACIAIASSAATKKESRITRGQIITIDKAPYAVQLRSKLYGSFECAGTLVTRNHVVTAAHCIVGLIPKDELIVVGAASTQSEEGIHRNIEDSSFHPQFNKNISYTHDIAVLKLESPMEGPNTEPINLCSKDIDQGVDYLQVSGWGLNEYGYMDDNLNTIRVPTIAYEQCEKYYSYTRLSNTMICASVPGDKDACQGDSGGPAVHNGELCGVVSWGRGCASSKYPGIYTNTRNVMDFLEAALKA